MNKNEVLNNLSDLADALDASGKHVSANMLTDVMRRVSQAWWQNEAGEPMYSPEAIRAEERGDEFGHEPDYDSDRHYQEDEEPEKQAPSPEIIDAISQIMGPPGTPFLKGYKWGPLSDSIAFENDEDLNTVVTWLNQHPEYNNEWEGYTGPGRTVKEITMPYQTDEIPATENPREDFGWAGDERLMGE